MNVEKIDLVWGLYKESPAYKTNDYNRLKRDLIFDKDVVIEAVDMMIADYDLKIKLLKNRGIKNVNKKQYSGIIN